MRWGRRGERKRREASEVGKKGERKKEEDELGRGKKGWEVRRVDARLVREEGREMSKEGGKWGLRRREGSRRKE